MSECSPPFLLLMVSLSLFLPLFLSLSRSLYLILPLSPVAAVASDPAAAIIRTGFSVAPPFWRTILKKWCASVA